MLLSLIKYDLFIFITPGGGYCFSLCQSVLLMFSSNSFILLDLTFRSLIHFEFIFIYGISEVKVIQLCPTL